jgi:predicted dehydrogenase
LLWLAGDVTEVSARCTTQVRAIEVEDNAVAWLEFSNGAIGTVMGSTVCYPGEPKRVELKGDKGSLTLVDDKPTFWQFADERPEDESIRAMSLQSQVGGGSSEPKAISINGHQAQIADFAAAIREGREPAIPGREGRRAVQLIRAIYDSSANNTIVRL